MQTKHLNLTRDQARHLSEHRRLLVVQAVVPQPTQGLRRAVLATNGAPYKPGDVVPCREPWLMAAVGRVYFTGESDGTVFHAWHSAASQPKESIRFRPVVQSVECRRVSSMTNDLAEAAAFGESRSGDVFYRPFGTFQNAWHKRHRRRWPEFGFDVAWAWWTVLGLE